jgi:hypothetical protein
MITSNTYHFPKGKVATIKTESFKCMISTAKEGLFKKQSMIFWDINEGMASRKIIGKLFFHDLLNSAQRLEMHDIIVHVIDEAGMSGKSIEHTLGELFNGLKSEGIAYGILLENYDKVYYL